MTDDEKAYWDGMMAQINVKLDDILDKLAAVRADTDNTKGHVLYVMNDSLTLSQRITKLEDEMRKRGAP